MIFFSRSQFEKLTARLTVNDTLSRVPNWLAWKSHEQTREDENSDAKLALLSAES